MKEKKPHALTGRKLPEEVKEKMSASHKGKKMGPLSEEHKEKIRQTKTGVPRKPFTDEHRANMKLAWVRRRKRNQNETK